MTKIEHSPGPWTANTFYGNSTVYDANGKAVANVRGRKDGQNKHVISAAPETLDALERLLAQIVETSAYDDARKGEDDGLLSDVEAARAAIAKAKGVLSFEQIKARFEAVGFGAAVFPITDKPGLVAGVSLDALPDYGTNAALDAVTDGLDARAETYELVFTGNPIG